MSIDSKEFQKILDDFYGTASVQGSTKQEERDLIAHINEKMQLDALDAARYRALFETEDFMRNPLWPVIDWMRGSRDVSKEEVDEALDFAIKEPK